MKQSPQGSTVLSAFRLIFTPPLYDDDNALSATARRLHSTAWIGVGLTFVHVSLLFFVFPASLRGLLVFAPFALLLFGSTLALIYARRLTLATRLFLSGAWVIITLITVLSGGTKAPYYWMYSLVVMTSLLYRQLRMAIFYGSLTIGAGCIMALAANANLLPSPVATPISAWISQSITLIALGLIVWLAVRDSSLALAKVQEQLSERMKAEAALRESEERFRLISSVTSDYTFYSRFTAGNGLETTLLGGAFEAISGYTAQEYLARGGWSATVHPADRDKDAQDLAMLRENRQVETEVRIIKKSGEVRWVRVNAHPIWDAEKNELVGINGAVRDITERKLTEQTLRENEAKFRAIFETSASAITIARQDGTVVDANPAFLNIVGKRRDEVLGKTPVDLGILPDILTMNQMTDQLWTNGSLKNREWEFRRDDGRVFDLLTSYRQVAIAERLHVLAVTVDITERKRAEASLAQERKLMRAVIDHIPDNIYVKDREGRFLLNNAESMRILGVARQEDLLGKSDFDFFPHDLARRWQEEQRAIMESGIPMLDSEEFLPWNSVKRRWIIGYAIPLHDDLGNVIGLVGINRDITDRKSAAEALRESEEKFRTFFELAPYGIMIQKRGGEVLNVNQAFLDEIGYRLEQIQGKNIFDSELFPIFRDREAVRRLTYQLENNGRMTNQEINIHHADGHPMTILISSQFIRLSGEVHVLTIGVDISYRKQREEEIKTLNAELELRVAKRTAQLEAVNKELESFSYSVSHDLRAPLRSIDGFSQALLEDYDAALDETGQNYLRRIRASAQRMGNMIDALLTLARISRSPLNLLSVDLSSLAAEVVTSLAEQQPERTVDVRIMPGVQGWGDARLLQIALQNLLQNAWKYTSKQASARIEFGARTIDEETVYVVSDNGVGFDMAYVDKLFGAFQRLHADSEFQGTGIGLATVHRVIHRHGGRIWAEAEVSHGATFYFTLGAWNHGS